MNPVLSSVRGFRALSTELSPIETPLIYSQSCFLNRYAHHKKDDDPLAHEILHGKLKPDYTIPYEYHARVSTERVRHLYLIHPALQIRAAAFLRDFGPAICERCQKSSFSVRSPVKVRPWKDFFRGGIPRGLKGLDSSRFPSFFCYEGFSRLYKFHASDDFMELERNFPLMMELDIQKCFYSIYTHSVTWAITEKKYAKSSFRKHPYESKLDKLLQKMNFNETNGIVVGPELSRVFSEIILQDIDVLAKNSLAERGLFDSQHYAIRRYIDNYYAFAFQSTHLELIKEVLESEIKAYKLYLNESKTKLYRRPFMTSQGRLSERLSELINRFFDDAVSVVPAGILLSHRSEASFEETLEVDDKYSSVSLRGQPAVYQITLARRRRVSARTFINEYRRIVSEHDFETGANASQVLGSIRRLLSRVEKGYVCHPGRSDQAYAEQAFSRDVGAIIHYFCSSSPSISTVDFGVDCLIRLRDICCASASHSRSFLAESTCRLFSDIFRNGPGLKASARRYPLEFSYFLSVLPIFEQRAELSESDLIAVWNDLEIANGDSDHFPYWLAMSMLFYACGRSKFQVLKARILKDYIAALSGYDVKKRADLALASLDLMRYPDFSLSGKRALYSRLARIYNVPTESVDVRQIVTSRSPWFIDWGQDVDIRSRMSARRLQAAY